MSRKNEPDFDDDLPPELEDIPEDAIPKKSTKTNQAGQGNLSLGDYAEVKPETVYTPQVEETKKEEPKKKESFGGNSSYFALLISPYFRNEGRIFQL